jgi:hypothetical protein
MSFGQHFLPPALHFRTRMKKVNLVPCGRPRASASIGCGTLLDHSLQLDIENRGKPVVAWLDRARRSVAEVKPAYPPRVPIARNFKGNVER